MEPPGINTGLLLTEVLVAAVVIGLPVISLIELWRKKLSGAPLALWVLIIYGVSILGSLAYWMVRPTSESKV